MIVDVAVAVRVAACTVAPSKVTETSVQWVAPTSRHPPDGSPVAVPRAVRVRSLVVRLTVLPRTIFSAFTVTSMPPRARLPVKVTVSLPSPPLTVKEVTLPVENVTVSMASPVTVTVPAASVTVIELSPLVPSTVTAVVPVRVTGSRPT